MDFIILQDFQSIRKTVEDIVLQLIGKRKASAKADAFLSNALIPYWDALALLSSLFKYMAWSALANTSSYTRSTLGS